MNVDFGRSVSYPFDDPNWTIKIGVLFVVGLVPGLNVILWNGYSMTVARNMVRRLPLLPDWDSWSDIAVRGLLMIAATLLYFLPLILLACGGGIVLPFLMGSQRGLLTAVQCCVGLAGFIYAIPASLLLQAGHIRYAQTDQFFHYVELGARIADIQQQLILYVMLLAIQFVIGLIAIAISALLAITCLIPVGVLTIAALSSGYVLGSAAVQAAKPA